MATTKILLDCTDQNLIVTEVPVIASGGINDNKVVITFSAEWNGLAKSAIFFTSNYKTVYEVVLTNGEATIPAEVLNEPGELFVGVRGVNSGGVVVKTSSLVKFKIVPGAPPADGTCVEPTANVYQQLLTAYGKTDAAISTETAERKAEIAVERARIDALVKLPEGSTTGDAELQDIRIGADGTTYESAGTAVREQFNTVNNSIVDEMFSVHNSENIIIPELFDGFARYASGEISNDSFDGYYKRTDYIYIPSLTQTIEHNFIPNDSGVDGIAFFDVGKNYIVGYKSNETIVEIPTGAKYVVFSNYDNLRTHADKNIKMCFKNITLPNNNVKSLVTFGDSHVARGLWQPKVIASYGVEKHVNLGIGGSTVATNANASELPFVDDKRISAIKAENPDTIIIIGGTNDVHLETPLGTIDELSKAIENKDKNNFYGAYSYLVETLLTWNPNLQIIVCTIPQGFYDNIHPVKYSEVSEAIRKIALYYSIPIVDIFSECGINKINLATYSDDLIHYNELGNERVASLIINTINKSYMTNV